MRLRVYILLCITAVFAGCKKDDAEPQYNFEAPAYFPAKHYDVPFNAKQFELGRKLFYDPILSADNTISCGSCHQQFAAFSHLDHKTSHGINGLLGKRNTPGLFNLAWTPAFMWDGGINHIEVMPLAPIQNPVEMNLPIANALVKLNQSSVYKNLFKDAFGVDEITDYQLFKAFAMFMSNLVSANSKYDQYQKGEIALSNDETEGMDLFMDKCANCHTPPLFTDFSYRNNGLDSVYFTDTGRNHITQLDEDKGKFKVPSLRNVALSYPYMHDGRFKTLDKVLDHYSSGIKQSATLDASLQTGIPLTISEKTKLNAFLNTLTDQDFIDNPNYANPN